MSQHVNEAINITQIQGVEARTGANTALRYHGGPVTFTYTTSRLPTSVSANQSTSRRIRICRWIRATLFRVLEAGWRRGQEDDRELERGRRRYSHLCESSLYIAPLRTFTPMSKTGLFSAAVAALVAVSVQDLKPSSQDISAFYLASIYQVLANTNGSQIIIPPTLPNPTTPFSPPTAAVWVNSLWFLSLVISLTCALLATLLQQWARRYMKVTQTRYSPHKRARIRAFFAEGVEKLHLPWAVEALPALLHLSLFLFFAGLAVFLFNINHTVFSVATSWIGFCTGMYMCITIIPMFRHDSPYYALLSSSTWYLYVGIRFTLFRILRWIAGRFNLGGSIWRQAHGLRWTYWQRILRGVDKEFEETALKTPSDIDGRALMWMYESLDEDHELEQFFAGIPEFCSSKVVDNPQSSLASLRRWRVTSALNGFLERTWSSNLVSETIKIRRLIICIRAIDAANLSHAAFQIFDSFFDDRPALFRSVELGDSLMSWGNYDDRNTTLFAQGIISCIIANVPQRNERWFSLTMRHLGISEYVLRSYLDHSKSISLAILIHFTRHLLHNSFEDRWHLLPLFNYGRLLSGFDVQNTLPGLQHDFCHLWNEMVLQGRDRGDYAPSNILGKFRVIHNALHQGSNLDNEYQLCSISSHRMGSTSNLIEVDGDRVAEAAHASITTSSALRHHEPVPSIIPPLTEYNAPHSLTSNLDHTNPDLVDEQSRNGVVDNVTPVASSFRLAPLDNDRISDNIAADLIQGTVAPPPISYMTNAGSRSTSSHGAATRPTRNMTNATPSFVPDTLPSPIPLLTVSSDPPEPHISADPTVGQSGRSPEGGPTSHPPSKF